MVLIFAIPVREHTPLINSDNKFFPLALQQLPGDTMTTNYNVDKLDGVNWITWKISDASFTVGKRPVEV